MRELKWPVIMTVAALLGHFFMPESWREIVPYVIAFIIMYMMALKIDDLLTRVSDLERKLEEHSDQLDPISSDTLRNIHSRLSNLEKVHDRW